MPIGRWFESSIQSFFNMQSQSYNSFQNRIQEIFNFAVLVTSAVPVLKHNLGLFDKNQISRISEPDFFEPSVVYEITDKTLETLKTEDFPSDALAKLVTIKNQELHNREFKTKVKELIGDELFNKNRLKIMQQSKSYIENIRSCSVEYQSKLASYLYFSLFSYFEAFVGDISKEVLSNLSTIDSDNKNYINKKVKDENFKSVRHELDKPFNKQRIDRYRKYSNQLDDLGYLTPEKLLLPIFIKNLKGKIDAFNANEIPSFLQNSFEFEFGEEAEKYFNKVRSNRNSIAHGDGKYSPSLKDVIEANKHFKKLSRNIDKHLTFNFFTLNCYMNK